MYTLSQCFYSFVMKHRPTYVHVRGERVRILLFDFVDGALGLLLVAARQYHVVAALAQVASRLVAEPGARTCHDDHSARHRPTCSSHQYSHLFTD